MKPLSRRQMLHAALMGGLGSLLTACPLAAVEQSAEPTAAPPLPTAAPVEPTAAPPAPTIPPATIAPAPAATVSPAPTAAATTAAPTSAPSPLQTAAIAQAAQSFLESLEGERRGMATYTFDDAERVRWHWTTPSGFPRNGLPLRDMTEAQRAAAMALLQQSVSPAGYQKSLEIMSLQRDLGNDPDLYYVTVFGNPGGGDPWSWRWEGHHLSRHITAVGEKLTVTPFFHGAWPTTSDQGLRAMPREEDAGRELITSLSGPVRDAAIFQSRTLSQHVTSNQPQVTPLEQVGVGYTELDPTQQGLVMEIIQSYLGSLHETASVPIFGRIQAAGLEQIRFGWAGALEPRKPHYYRIQGPTFLLEFDNSRNGGTHIHSVWRDFDEDFGHHLA
jgi:hypothetical protein